jgi:hypothetical protein
MLTRLRAGYAKIELYNGLVPGEGTSQDPAHLPTNNWVALYHNPQDTFATKYEVGLATSPAPMPYLNGFGRTFANLNFETGRAERSVPFTLRLLKEGFGSASGKLLQSMFQNVRIKQATFDFTKQNAKGEEVLAFQIQCKDGAISEWEVMQEGGGSKKVETLEYISIVASEWTFLKEAVWADTDGEQRVFGGFQYEKRAKI